MYPNSLQIVARLLDAQLCGRQYSIETNLAEINMMVVDTDVEPLYTIPRISMHPTSEYYNSYCTMTDFIKSVLQHSPVSTDLSEYALCVACRSTEVNPSILTMLTHLWVTTEFDIGTLIQLRKDLDSDSINLVDAYNTLMARTDNPTLPIRVIYSVERVKYLYDQRKSQSDQ